MVTKIELPAVPYGKIRPGQLFTNLRRKELYAMTYTVLEPPNFNMKVPVAISLNGDNSVTRYKEFGSMGEKVTIAEGNLMHTFDCTNLQQLLDTEFYVVHVEGTITEIL